jgi:O-antigen/teichoic acid export membrane protein
MIIQLASLGIYQSQAMIITQTLGPSQVVIFVVTYKVIALPLEVAYMGTAPFIPAFGEAKARRDWNWIRSAYKNAMVASIALGVPLAAALALVAKPLILILAGHSALPDSYLIFWLFVYTAISVCITMAGQMLSGVERPEPMVLSLILCALGCVVLGVLLAPWWGLSGVAFAMAISNIVISWPIQVYEVRRIFRSVNGATSESQRAV